MAIHVQLPVADIGVPCVPADASDAVQAVFRTVWATVESFLVSTQDDAVVLLEALAPSTPLMDAGLDSLDMLKLANLLSEALGVILPATVLFDFPSVDGLVAYVTGSQVRYLPLFCVIHCLKNIAHH